MACIQFILANTIATIHITVTVLHVRTSTIPICILDTHQYIDWHLFLSSSIHQFIDQIQLCFLAHHIIDVLLIIAFVYVLVYNNYCQLFQ